MHFWEQTILRKKEKKKKQASKQASKLKEIAKVRSWDWAPLRLPGIPPAVCLLLSLWQLHLPLTPDGFISCIFLGQISAEPC